MQNDSIREKVLNPISKCCIFKDGRVAHGLRRRGIVLPQLSKISRIRFINPGSRFHGNPKKTTVSYRLLDENDLLHREYGPSRIRVKKYYSDIRKYSIKWHKYGVLCRKNQLLPLVYEPSTVKFSITGKSKIIIDFTIKWTSYTGKDVATQSSRGAVTPEIWLYLKKMAKYAKINIKYLDRTYETKSTIMCSIAGPNQLCRLPGFMYGGQVMGFLLEYISGMTHRTFVKVNKCPIYPEI